MTEASSSGQRPTGVHRTRVEWIDTDASGVYHNAAVTRYVEAAEARLMRERGLDAYVPTAPRVHYEVDFEAPLRFDQEVTTTVVLDRLGTSSMTFGFEVWGATDAGPVRAARGSFSVVHVGSGLDAGSRAAAVPWPQEWRTALGH